MQKVKDKKIRNQIKSIIRINNQPRTSLKKHRFYQEEPRAVVRVRNSDSRLETRIVVCKR